ncbi:MAG: helix-turn-helix transcriptional regulator [Thermonemataceae bacterium]
MMSLNDKVKALLIHKDLQPSKLADMLEVPRSTISHILSGRNKPSLDLVRKILELFPELNPDWLLFDDTEMLRGDGEELEEDSSSVENVADITQQENQKLLDTLIAKKSNGKKKASNEQKQIERIIIFYDDKSFEVYEWNVR